MPNRSIERLRVKNLFGAYNYELHPAEAASEPNRLLILYGDNGTGKTTVLRMLFHLISPESRQGHKTTLVRIPISEFEVQFANGDKVWMKRPPGKLTGRYTVGIKVGRRKLRTVEFTPDEDGGIVPSPETEGFLKELRSLELAIYFLSDDRSVRFAGANGLEPIHFFENYVDEEILVSSDLPNRVIHRSSKQNIEERSHLLLHQSIRRSEQWLQSQAVRSASEGESSVNVLYGEILKLIPGISASSDPPQTKPIFSKISQLEARSLKFAKYGLTPSFQGQEIVQIIKNTPKTQVSLVTAVIEPYLESVERKLNAMQDLQGRIDALVTQMNSFFRDKKISYDVHEGFTITNLAENPLKPQMLSSGERHLLLLFCNTVPALHKPSIFLIDEPEISLNVKWQRRLLSALLKCAEGQPVQYILATHSFELLSRYRNNTVRLGS